MKRQHAPLGELCTLVKGTSPISKTLPGKYPLVTTGEAHKTSDTFQFDAEAVCIPTISSTGHGHASLKRVHYQAGKFALSNIVAAALVKDRSILSAKYLTRYLMYTKDRLIVPLMTGAANMSISIDRLATVPIKFPLIAEQERIVRLLDEADELRKQRALTDRRAAALLPSLFHELFGGAKVWPSVRVEEAGRVQLGRQRSPKYQTGKFTRPYVRVANVHEDAIDVSDLLAMDFDKRDFEQYRLEYGDILLNEGQSTELVGRPAMWRNEVPNCCFQNTLVRFQPDKTRVLPEFALGLFLSYFRTGEFAKISSKTSNVAHLGAARFAKMPFVLPPLSLQREFAQRMSEIRDLEACQAQSKRRLDDLFQSMLHGAFNSHL